MFDFSAGGSWFLLAWAVGDEGGGDVIEHRGVAVHKQPASADGKNRRGCEDGSGGFGKADSQWIFDSMFDGSFEHDRANHIQRHNTSGEFFLNPGYRATSQHIGIKPNLQLTEQRFDSPSACIERDNFIGFWR